MERFNSFSSDQIVITKRQLSMAMASILLFCLFVFMVGFFLGKRTVIDDFSSKVTKETLHDQIDFLLTTQSLASAQEQNAVIEAEPEIEQSPAIIASAPVQNAAGATMSAAPQEKVIYDQIISPDVSMARPDNFPVIEARASSHQKSEAIIEVNKPQYAQLIGFGTKQAAQAFVARLKKHNVPVILKTIMSKTASGKQRTWYQAITPTYESSKELQEQIAKIKKLEHIRGSDIKIMNAK